MTTRDRQHDDNTFGLGGFGAPSRRDLLKAGGAVLGTLALGRGALAQTPKPGGTIISAQNNEATGLDPQLVPAFSRSRRSPLTYSQLVRFDENMAIQPELAESWTLSDDKLTWTFKLRQGVKFHDGQELTSDDVKFTFDRLLEKSAGGKADFTAVDKVEPAGKYQVKLVTKEPFAALIAALAGFWGYIVSEAGVKQGGGDLNKTAMGTGPFMLADWKVEQQMVFKKNPNYYKKGLPYVDEVVIRTIPDEANIVAALRAGQIHHAFIEDNKNWNLLKDEKALTGYRSSRLGYDYLNISANRVNLPADKPWPLKDVRVRQAISYAVDRSAILRVAAAGFGRLTAPATAPMKQWQLPEDQWMKYYKPDLDKAKKLLADAGLPEWLRREALRHPDVPDDGQRGAGRGREPEAHRDQRRDRERRVRGVDQAVARPRLRHDDEHHAGVRRPRHRVLPGAPRDQGPELEQLQPAPTSTECSRRAGGRST